MKLHNLSFTFGNLGLKEKATCLDVDHILWNSYFVVYTVVAGKYLTPGSIATSVQLATE